MAAAQVDNRPSNSRADDTPSNTATQQSSSSQIADGPNAPAQTKDRRRSGRGPQNDGAAPAVTRSDQPSGRGRGGQRGGGRGRQQQSNNNNGGESSNQNNGGNSRGNGGRNRGGRGRGRDQANTGSSAPAAGSGSGQPQAQSEADIPAVSARKRNFGGKITTGDDAISSNTTAHGKGKAVAHAAPPPPPQIREYADLRSRLVAELGSGQHECSICYSTLTTRQPCWSCDQCYTVLHLNCTKKWASTSVEQANAQLAMQEDPEMRARRGTWRCPGCQFAREDVPQGYCDVEKAAARTVAVRNRVIQVLVPHAPSRSPNDVIAANTSCPCDARRSIRRVATQRQPCNQVSTPSPAKLRQSSRLIAASLATNPAESHSIAVRMYAQNRAMLDLANLAQSRSPQNATADSRRRTSSVDRRARPSVVSQKTARLTVLRAKPRDESTYVPTLAFPGQDVPMWKGKAGESDILRRRCSDVWEQVRESAALRPSGHRFQMSSWRMPTM
ncbi:FKBP12-associated protein [Tilletia horrida]|uniref:FKBP12-associated protein n=1 Tax=Tilletia horrida TaxID=155126 RepID=A0AAN6JT74_9BASI|nr:FKBP12-associated protein [Tilletia horrida]KAK0555265.1 FKBP12-associated protein [Tilletia horrida]